MNTIAAQVADFVEQHTGVTLAPWQRAVLHGLYATPPDTTA